MKKNLRIVSAAAAALLAVAPVAASAVSANAAVTVNGNVQSQDTHKASDITVNISLDAKKDTTVSQALNSAKVTVDGATLTGYKASNLAIVKDGQTTKLPGDTPLETNQKYKIVIKHITFTNLTTGTPRYTISGGKITAGATADANNEYTAEALKPATDLTFTSDSFNVFDTTKNVKPYFVNKNSVVAIADGGTVAGTVPTSNLNTLSSIEDAIKDKVKAEDGEIITQTNSGNDSIAKQLKDQKVNVNGTSVDTDKNYTITVTAQNMDSGKTATVKVAFVAAPEYSKYPIMYFQKDGNGKFDNGTGAVAIKQGNRSNPDLKDAYIKFDGKSGSQFRPTDYFKAATADNKAWTNNFTVEANNVDSSKSGVYSVTVSAKNAAGETKVTMPVVVVAQDGDIASIKNAPGFPVDLYNINNGTVVKAENNYENLYNGASVLTYETKTIDGKSYTRIDTINGTTGKADGHTNLWVESDKLSNYKPATEESVSTRIMYKSAIYNGKMENTHQTIKGYDYEDLVVDKDGNLKEFNLNGNKMYKIANKDEYVRARNVKGKGSPMTLKHNAYVYKSNGKRANKKVLKKGRTITVYGGSYKAIKKYKGKAVRIGVNRYVKLANVNYKLDK